MLKFFLSQDLASVNTVTSVSPLFQDSRWLGGQFSWQEPLFEDTLPWAFGSEEPV